MPIRDFHATIKATERNECVFVDKYDDNLVWLSVQVRGGNAHVTLTNDQARQMMAALAAILNDKEAP